MSTFHPLHSWHYTLYIRHQHMTTQKVYLPSHPLYLTLHPLYVCHQTQCINCITPTRCMTLHTICMISQSVCMTSHEHFMTSYPYRYDITQSIFITSKQYIWDQRYCFPENTTIPDITPTIFGITATVILVTSGRGLQQRLWKDQVVKPYSKCEDSVLMPGMQLGI